jgi:hypothetical protein
MTDAPASAPTPDDAGDTRGMHFRRLIRHPLTLVLGGLALVGTGVAVGVGVGPLFGLIGAAAVLVLLLVLVLVLANKAAAADFFRAYAAGRSLAWNSGRSPVPPATPLLRKGDDRYVEEAFAGTLPGGANGTLALYTYEEESTDSKGNRSTTYVHFTVAMFDLPETASFLNELDCQRRVGLRALDHAEDAFRTRQRVELESDALDKRYEIFAGQHDDMNRVHQVFEPSFIVWLADEAPREFAFELAAGALVVNVKGHKKTAVELDAICNAGSRIAARLSDEARE